MERQELLEIVKDAVREEELCSSEIPAIDLYVDQIINLVNEKTATGSKRYEERQLTKTMINNYSKDGLITPVKGKKYNREQILQILTVFTLKSTLSIGEIKRVLDGAYAIEGFDASSLQTGYDRHLEIKRDNREYALQIAEELIEKNELDLTRDGELITLIGSLLSLSAFLRQSAQAILDVAYPAPPEEDKEREKEEKERLKELEKEEKEREKEREREEKERAKKEKEKEKDKKKKNDESQES